jgi:hypothetical protein
MGAGSDSAEYDLGIRASQSLWPERREGLLDMVDGRERAEGLELELVLKVYSEIKEGTSLSAPASFVLVL